MSVLLVWVHARVARRARFLDGSDLRSFAPLDSRAPLSHVVRDQLHLSADARAHIANR